MRASTSTCGSARSIVERSADDGVQLRRQVRDDERVGAIVDLHVAARRERRFLDERRSGGRSRVAERERADGERAGVGGRLGERLPRVLLLPQRVDPRDADDRAVDGVVELIAAQDDVERLIPRYFVEDDVDRALHVRIDHHVETADLREPAQHRAEVGALEVEAHRVTGEALLPSGGLLQRSCRCRRRRSEHNRRRARYTACRRRLGRWRGRPSRRGRLGARSRGARRLDGGRDGACVVERRHRVRGRGVRRDRRRVPDRLLHADRRVGRFRSAGIRRREHHPIGRGRRRLEHDIEVPSCRSAALDVIGRVCTQVHDDARDERIAAVCRDLDLLDQRAVDAQLTSGLGRHVGEVEHQAARSVFGLHDARRHQLTVPAQRDGGGRWRAARSDALEERGRPRAFDLAGERVLDAHRGRRVRLGLRGRSRQFDADGVARAPDTILRRSGQRHADAGERRAVDRGGLFELDAGERTASNDVGSRVRDADVSQIHEQRERVRPAHGIRHRLGRFDEDGVVLRRDTHEPHRRGRG